MSACTSRLAGRRAGRRASLCHLAACLADHGAALVEVAGRLFGPLARAPRFLPAFRHPHGPPHPLCLQVAGSILDVKMNKSPSDVTATIGI